MRRSVLRIAGLSLHDAGSISPHCRLGRLTVDDTFLGRTSLPSSRSSRKIDVVDDPIPDDNVILSEVKERALLIGCEVLVSKHRDTSIAPPGGSTAGSRTKTGAIRRLA